VTDLRIISFGVGGIAMIFFAVGIYLLASFQLRQWRCMQKRSASGQIPRPRDLWDDQLDG
jgi:hypothetical protein